MKPLWEKLINLFLIKVSLNYVLVEAFSHISSVLENGRPILRDIQTEDSISTTTEKQWLETLRERISQYVSDNGYEEAKPLIDKLVKDTESSKNVLLFVKVARNGTTDIASSPVMRAKKHKKHKKRTKDEHESSEEPTWLIELKTFIRQLVEIHGREVGKAIMETYIKSMEKKYMVVINDIDMDPFGNVLVTFIETKGREKYEFGLRKDTSAS